MYLQPGPGYRRCSFRHLAHLAHHNLVQVTAIAAAEQLIRSYRPEMLAPEKALVGVAARILVEKKKADAARLIRILEFEIIQAERGRKPKAVPKEEQGIETIQFRSPTIFVEDWVVSVGMLNHPRARGVLRGVCKTPGMRGRAEALIMLASKKDPEDLPIWVKALEDPDPWIRFMAYRALKYILGKDAPCDWIYGAEQERQASVEQYRTWAEERKR